GEERGVDALDVTQPVVTEHGGREGIVLQRRGDAFGHAPGFEQRLAEIGLHGRRGPLLLEMRIEGGELGYLYELRRGLEDFVNAHGAEEGAPTGKRCEGASCALACQGGRCRLRRVRSILRFG